MPYKGVTIVRIYIRNFSIYSGGNELCQQIGKD